MLFQGRTLSATYLAAEFLDGVVAPIAPRGIESLPPSPIPKDNVPPTHSLAAWSGLPQDGGLVGMVLSWCGREGALTGLSLSLDRLRGTAGTNGHQEGGMSPACMELVSSVV